MSYWEGILLGVVQGLTEFLPISSSGHLVLTGTILGLTTPGVVVEVGLHFATLVAIVIVYRSTLAQLVVGCVRGDTTAWTLVGLLAVGTVPAVVLGLTLQAFIERTFDSLILVGADFMVTGAILWSTRLPVARLNRHQPTWGGALVIGLSQALALLPGVSRSGATVAAGIWLDVEPVRAAEYSFLLAIPAILGATALQLSQLSSVATLGVGPLIVACVSALVAGVAAIRFLVLLLSRGTFYRFAPYCWMIGLITISWALLTG